MPMTMTELKEVLEPLEGLAQVSVPRKGGHAQLAVSDDGDVVYQVSGNEYSITDNALEQVFSHVPGLGKAALTQWPEEMLLNSVNWFLANQDGNIRAVTMGEAVVSFPKRDVPIHSPIQVVEAIESSIPADDLEAYNVKVGIDRTMFALVSPETTSEPKVGDIVRGGIYTHLSPTGNLNIEMSPYVDRLVCTNGMISPTHLGRWSWKGDVGDGGFYNWVTSFASESWAALDEEFQGLHVLAETPVNGHTEAVLRDLFNRHRVPSTVRESVMAAAIDEADGTMYGIAQAFNRAANNVDNLSHMRDLWMVTGEMAHQSERCGSCFRALN